MYVCDNRTPGTKTRKENERVKDVVRRDKKIDRKMSQRDREDSKNAQTTCK